MCRNPRSSRDDYKVLAEQVTGQITNHSRKLVVEELFYCDYKSKSLYSFSSGRQDPPRTNFSYHVHILSLFLSTAGFRASACAARYKAEYGGPFLPLWHDLNTNHGILSHDD